MSGSGDRGAGAVVDVLVSRGLARIADAFGAWSLWVPAASVSSGGGGRP